MEHILHRGPSNREILNLKAVPTMLCSNHPGVILELSRQPGKCQICSRMRPFGPQRAQEAFWEGRSNAPRSSLASSAVKSRPAYVSA